MTNIPVFYVDETIHLLTGEEWKVLMYAVHKIIGDKIPFDGLQTAKIYRKDLIKKTGLTSPETIEALAELFKYQILLPTPTPDGIEWTLGPLQHINLEGLAARKLVHK